MENNQMPVPQPNQTPPATQPPNVTVSDQMQSTKTTASEKLWFGLAICVLVSVFIRLSWIFFLPIVAFGVLASRGFFNDASNRSKPAKGALLVFKIIAVIGIATFIVIGAVVMFFIAALSFGGGHMG